MCTMNDGVWIMITDPYAAPRPQRTSKIQLQGPDAVYCIWKLFREGRLHINNIVYVGYLCSLVSILQKKVLGKSKKYTETELFQVYFSLQVHYGFTHLIISILF